ncbi:hypothetical protein F5Y19DRAFT_448497 [Xylariaceae sp. FL1651]|nr:hypothetical protein F5Y19DRAFT_448497 [Xylariaceae sp. FL1651]
MTFTKSTYDGILGDLRRMIERVDPRGAYYIEPTWRINGATILQRSRPESLQTSLAQSPTYRAPVQPRKLRFKERLRSLNSSQLREIIMNACLKSLCTHKKVVRILKRMQKKKPRPFCSGGSVRRPTVGLYLYCRTQRELVEIILELAEEDGTGCFKQDVKDLIMVMEKQDSAHDMHGIA